MVSNELKGWKSMMMTMEMEDHGDGTISNGLKSPYGQWRGFFAHAHVTDANTMEFIHYTKMCLNSL